MDADRRPESRGDVETSKVGSGSGSSMVREDLSRRYFIDVTADGAAFVRGHGTPVTVGVPGFWCDTYEQAKALIVLHCRLARDGSGVYHLNEWNGGAGLDALYGWSARFRASYAQMKAKRGGRR